MNRRSIFDEIALKDVISFVVDNRGKTVPVEDSGIPLITTANISNSELYPSVDTDRYVSEEIYSNWFRSHPQVDDVILTNKGSKNGEVCLVPNPVEFCIAQDMVALRANKKIIHPKYLFASLRSSLVQKRIKLLNVDAVIPHFKKSDFDKLFIPLPSLDVQEFIGQIYFDISLRIELNRKTNETLEGVAKALFKSWFVDFYPVKAKTEGRSTGFADEISELFPDSYEDSELGEIPSGWHIKSLDDIANFLNGLAIQKYPPKSEHTDLPVIKIAQLRKGNTLESDQCSDEIGEEYVIKDGDILFSWSGSLLVDIWTGGVGALNQHLFKVTSDHYKKWFYYYWTKHHLQEFQSIAKSKATTMGHIQRRHLSEAKVLVPSDECFSKMSSVFDSLLERQLNIRLESRTLTQLRDALLPKLISGKLRVTDAEKILEEVGL